MDISPHLISNIANAVTVELINETYNFEICSGKIPSKNSIIVFTNGLSKRRQEVDENNLSYERIELYFCLPDYWNLEKDNWPIHFINLISQIPKKNDTWFGPGDTIPTANPPAAINDKFSMNHFILTKPLLFESELNEITSPKYLAIIPIYQVELDFKLRNSATILIQKFIRAGNNEMVDQYRKAVCRKRLLGLI